MMPRLPFLFEGYGEPVNRATQSTDVMLARPIGKRPAHITGRLREQLF